MVLLVGISLGFAALMLRSAVAAATVGALIFVVFCSAWLFCGHAQLLPLLVALAGYNLGMAGGFAVMLAIQKIRPA